jgi:hypothetical protein
MSHMFSLYDACVLFLYFLHLNFLIIFLVVRQKKLLGEKKCCVCVCALVCVVKTKNVSNFCLNAINIRTSKF